jgi:spermidine synthase
VKREADAIRGIEKQIRQIGAAVIVCFFFSGATGLIYEVLWTRMLGLVFGHTVFAITTVLAAFMAGLGLGSYWFGKIADRHQHPLRLYGILEIGIGIYALLTPMLFSRAEQVYIGLYKFFGLSFLAFSLAQFSVIYLILLLPTMLMGATLPILSRFFVREIQGLGGQVGRLYALNTFGAVLGTYASGFHMIPRLGLERTLLSAAVINIGIGVLCVVLDRHLSQLGGYASSADSPSPIPRGADSPTPQAPALDAGRLGLWMAIVGLGISGAASMMYEVAWTRSLSLVIGSSTYAFSTMLVTFLTGLALGSFLFSRLVGDRRVGLFFFGALQLAIGLGALLVTPFFDRMPEAFLYAFRFSQSPGFMKVLQFTISVLAMFLPTLFMGATFPCVAQIASRELSHVGSDIGRIYFANTLGAIAGTVLAGFLLIPTWGIQSTLKLAVFLNLGLASILFLATRAAGWWRGTALLPLLAMIALYVTPPWNAQAMASGVAIYGRSYFGYLGKSGFQNAIATLDDLVFYRDGISATVSVHQEGDKFYLRVNGKTDASNTRDMHTQLMLGHLPLLFRPDAKRVLVIGLGSGVTAGAVAAHPVERIDIVEIEPAVVEASVFFRKDNRDILRNPRAKVFIADGRNSLLAAEHPYDVIISEPSNPWMRGIGNLFSVEFYDLAARRLAPGGLVCQWIHVYNLFPQDLKMVVNTFRSAFPHTTIWSTIQGDLLLIGTREPLALDYTRLLSQYESLAGLREDMARIGFRSPLAFLADFLLTEEGAARYTERAWLNTDDLPLLEFSAPESLYADTVQLNQQVLRTFRRQELPRILNLPENTVRSAGFRRTLGLAFWAKDRPEEAIVQFDEALRFDPGDVQSLFHRGQAHLRLGSVLRAEADFKAALALSPEAVEIHDALAQLYKAQKMWEMAEAELRRALALKPKDARLLATLADLLRERQRFAEAVSLYREALSLAPNDPRLWAALGLASQGSGRSAEALDAFRQAVSKDPQNGFFQYQLGQALLEAKQLDAALTALRIAAARDPLKAEPRLALGRLHAMRGEKRSALQEFRHALRLDPGNAMGRRAAEELSMALDGPGS